MTKNTKTLLHVLLASVLFASFTMAACNNSSEKKAEEPAKDSVSATKSMEAAPAPAQTPDSTHKRDTVKTRPTPTGN